MERHAVGITPPAPRPHKVGWDTGTAGPLLKSTFLNWLHSPRHHLEGTLRTLSWTPRVSGELPAPFLLARMALARCALPPTIPQAQDELPHAACGGTGVRALDGGRATRWMTLADVRRCGCVAGADGGVRTLVQQDAGVNWVRSFDSISGDPALDAACVRRRIA